MSARPADYSVDSENMPEQKDYLLTSLGGAHQCLCQVNLGVHQEKLIFIFFKRLSDDNRFGM